MEYDDLFCRLVIPLEIVRKRDGFAFLEFASIAVNSIVAMLVFQKSNRSMHLSTAKNIRRNVV